MDEIDLEKAGGQLGEPSAAPDEFKSEISSGDKTSGDKAGGQTRETDSKSSNGPREDAKMWALYLEEAETEAKERAEVMGTDLDTLLIFVGLFAGIVASFVIDTRRDLQPDAQQILLTDIRNALRNETAPQETFIPSTLSLWINGLWFASFIITLFSAILGVLAKSWLAKFTPVVSGKKSEDAYHRYIRDEKAKDWHLEQIITAAPLLIQIAVGLFSLGFGLQSVSDHPALGWIVLASVFIATFLYIVVTLLPLFIPWCPLQTPLSHALSDALLGIAALYRSSDSTSALRKGDSRVHLSWRDGPDHDEVLPEIWGKKLIQSTNPSNVDEALAELIQSDLGDKWWQRFMTWNTPEILCRRLRESMPGIQREYQYEVLCKHLRSLLGFVDYLESLTPPKPRDISRSLAPSKPSDVLQSPASLKVSNELKEFLAEGNALHRWNFFPEQVRALAFSARTPIMIACHEDYTPSEMEERPWETIVRHMPPDHRQDFAMAACRGLVGDQKGLRKVSALSIAISVAKATTTAIGPTSEWGVGIDREKKKVKQLGQEYLERLFEEIGEDLLESQNILTHSTTANGWKTLLHETLGETSSINSDSRDMMIWGGLDPVLKHRDSNIRTRAITMLEAFATDAEFGDLVKSSIPKLVDIVVNDPDEAVRAKGTKTLMKLVQNEKFPVPPAHNYNLSSALASNYESLPGAMRAIKNLTIFIQHPDFQVAMWQDDVEQLMPMLIILATDMNFDSICIVGTNAVASLVQDERFREIVKLALLKKLESALHGQSVVLLTRLITLFQRLDSQVSENGKMTQLVEMIMGQEDPGRMFAIHTLVSLTQGDDILRNTILPQLSNILQIPPSHTRFTGALWIDVLDKLLGLADHADFQSPIESAVPALLKITMNDTDENIHTIGIKVLTSLAGPPRNSIKLSLTSELKSALKDPKREARICTLKTLVILVQYFNSRDTTEAMIQELIRVVENEDVDDVCAVAVKSLSTLLQGVSPISLSLQENLKLAFKGRHRFHFIDALGKNPQLRDIILSEIPNIVEMAVNDENTDVKTAGMKLVGSIVKDGVHENIVAIGPIVANILGSDLKNFHWQVRVAGFEMLVILAQDPNFRSSVESALHEFIRIATKDENADVRAAGLKYLASIVAQDSDFRSTIESSFTTLLDSAVNDPNWSIRVVRAEIRVMLAQIPSYQAYIKLEIPKLVDMVARDTDKDVRVATVRSLITLAQDDASQTMRSDIKSALPKVLDLAYKDPDWNIRIAWIDALAEFAHSRSTDFEDYLLSAIPKLVKIITGDKEKNVRITGMKVLTSLLAQDSKLDKKAQDITISALPKSLDSVFDDPVLCSDWIRVLDILIRGVRLEGIIESAIPKIVEVATQHDVAGVRKFTIELLAFLAESDPTGKLRDTIISALSKSLDLVFKTLGRSFRYCAIRTLDTLVTEYRTDFHKAVTSAMPQLLRIAIKDYDDYDDDDVSNAAAALLNKLRPSANVGAKESLGDAILLAVPSAVILFAPEGDDIRQTIDSLMQFAETPTNHEDIVKSMENDLKPMLKGTGWLKRATAVEFLGVLGVLENYSDTSFRKFIQSRIPDIIALAFEDKEDDVRAAAIRSLVNLAEKSVFRNKIKAVLPQLMRLVEKSRLGGPVTELISLLAVDDTVRKDIISQIINPFVSSKTEVNPDGLLELLSRLIIDKRLARKQASDEVVLSVASVLLMQPGAASFRLKTATALWCNYGVTYTSHPRRKFSSGLVDLFLIALFGSHVTKKEVKKWNLMAFHLELDQESGSEVAAVEAIESS